MFPTMKIFICKAMQGTHLCCPVWRVDNSVVWVKLTKNYHKHVSLLIFFCSERHFYFLWALFVAFYSQIAWCFVLLRIGRTLAHCSPQIKFFFIFISETNQTCKIGAAKPPWKTRVDRTFHRDCKSRLAHPH